MDLYNKKAESAILGSILENNSGLGITSSILEVDDFYGEDNRKIYQTMLSMSDAAIDIITLEHKMEQDGLLPLNGGSAYTASLMDEACLNGLLEDYIKIVKQHSLARNVRVFLLEAIDSIENMVKPDEVAFIVQELAEKTAESMSVISPHDGLGETFAYLEKVQTGEVLGKLTTGIDILDKYAPGTDELVIIGARPSTGKTALALHIADYMAKEGKNILFFSIEMSERSIHMRRWAANTGISLYRMRNKGALDDKEWANISETINELKSRKLAIIDSVSSMASIVAETKKRNAIQHVDAVFVDHLHLLRLPSNDRRDLQLKIATDTFARMSKRLGMTMFLLSQLNRQSEYRKSGEPSLGDLRDSGASEEDADIVWMLHRPDRYDHVKRSEMNLFISKNRNGPTGKVIFGYNPESGKFYEEV